MAVIPMAAKLVVLGRDSSLGGEFKTGLSNHDLDPPIPGLVHIIGCGNQQILLSISVD